MQQEIGPEKFKPIEVARFNRRQLMRIYAWGYKNNVTGEEALDRALETVRGDEEGKRMNEVSRRRIRYGVAVLTGLKEAILETEQPIFRDLLMAQVWQDTPDEGDLRVQITTGPRGSQN